MSAGYNRWVAAGSPRYGMARPIVDLKAVLNAHGFDVGTIGDTSHMSASVWEDHTWASQTGWPQPAAIGWEYALDIMPRGGGPGLGQLGARLIADKIAGHPAMAWLKYANWTPPGGSCRHESWEPGHQVVGSSDSGHIHMSCRTDYLHSTCVSDNRYDPVAALTGGGAITVVSYNPPAPPAGQGPAFPGRTLVARHPMMYGSDVRTGQQRLHDRGWVIGVDGWYGPQSADVVRRFQQDSSNHRWPLHVDSELGPQTWQALWARPVS